MFVFVIFSLSSDLFYWKKKTIKVKRECLSALSSNECLLCLLKERYIWASEPKSIQTLIRSGVTGHSPMGQDPGAGHDATPAKWRSPLSTKHNLLSGNQDQTRSKSWKNGAAFQLKELQWTLYDVISSPESRSFTRSLTTKTKLYSVFSLYWNNLENFHSKLFELWEKSWSLVRFLMEQIQSFLRSGRNKHLHTFTELHVLIASIYKNSFVNAKTPFWQFGYQIVKL